MEEQMMPEQEEQGYVERPKWQVWAARVAVVVLVGLIILYYITIARGGM
jgi:hypothetical protein